MQTRIKFLPALCCIALLGGCASNQTEKNLLWSMSSTAKADSVGLTPAALYQMGRYFQGQNRLDLALEAYHKALTADQSYAEAHNGVGVIQSRQGRYVEAIAAFNSAIALKPDAAHLHSNLGYAYCLQGSYADAVLALQKATKLEPTNKRALNNLGLAQAKLGNQPQSMHAFAESLNISAEESLSAETDSLTLDKHMGVLQPATTVPVIESSVQLTEVSPKVFELQYPVEIATISLESKTDSKADITSEIRPATSNIRFEVANGNGLNGMAKKVSQYLNGQGYSIPRLTNQKPYQVTKTQIQYRESRLAEAELLRASLQDVPELVLRNDLRADIQVRLVLGKDILRQTSGPDDKWQQLKVAIFGSSA